MQIFGLTTEPIWKANNITR